MKQQHYICGYGSLISHDSRYRFSDIDAQGIPVEVVGWQRSWNMASPGESITCVGAVPSAEKQQTSLNSVLVEVAEIDEKLRKREQNYHFVELDIADIRFHQKEQSDSELDFDCFVKRSVKIWICQVANPQTSKETHPICQSYVDTCLSGCLEHVDEEFATKFIEQTHGWDGTWLNDRNNPLYPRAADVSREMQQRIDELLHDLDVLRFRQEFV